jgi:uracil-DNA glycosylase family 4
MSDRYELRRRIDDWDVTTAPGMTPGPDLVRWAGGDTHRLVQLYRALLTGDQVWTLPVEIGNGQTQPVMFLPGHAWGDPTGVGPVPASVLLLGKMPGFEEEQYQRNFIGASGKTLRRLLAEYTDLHETEYNTWYVTNLVRFRPPGGKQNLRSNWKQDCLPLVQAELRLVRPQVIVCLGADAAKALLGNQTTLASLCGRVLDYPYPLALAAGEDGGTHTAKLIAMLHPVEVARDAAKAGQCRTALVHLNQILRQRPLRAAAQVQGEVITTLPQLEAWVERTIAHYQRLPRAERLLTIDCEWHGSHPVNPGSYLRTIQLGTGPHTAALIQLTEPGGAVSFCDATGRPALRRLAEVLERLWPQVRPVGHFLVADLVWLRYYGIDPIAPHPIPLGPDGPRALAAGVGWLDTGLATHALQETAALGLEVLAEQYADLGRYDLPMAQWKKDHPHEPGFGNCPSELLYPYALADACATYQVAQALLPQLARDAYGNCAYEAFWESMAAQAPILAMLEAGVTVDLARLEQLRQAFQRKRDALEAAFRQAIGWPEFNFRSTPQMRELLFGEQYNGKRAPLRPVGALSLGLTPVLDTSKPQRAWEDLLREGKAQQAQPATDKLALGLLIRQYPEHAAILGQLRDLRYLDQILKSVLNPQGAGLAGCIHADGRVRSWFSPTTETGRWRSSRPNLQNLSKRRDSDYARLLGDDYAFPLRSVLVASGHVPPVAIPEPPAHLAYQRKLPGWRRLQRLRQPRQPMVLVEFDYKGAELFGMAVLSGDQQMLDHVQRSFLPDSGYDESGQPVPGGKQPHPRYYDIHSNVAVLAFQLTCPPTKQGLKAAGKAHYRDLAKTVIFGIAYGRGAAAVARQSREMGLQVSETDAQAVIDAIFQTYPKLKPFFDSAKRQVQRGFIRHPLGRYRRFPPLQPLDRSQIAELERQAMNFPIQGLIASVVNRGLALLQRTIDTYQLHDSVRLLLQIHDAAVLEVDPHYVEYVLTTLLPTCMTQGVPIYPCDWNGKRRADGPYYLGYDVATSIHWGQPCDPPAVA